MSLYVILSGHVRIDRESEAGKSVKVDEVGARRLLRRDGPDRRSAAGGDGHRAEEPTECALLAKWDFQNELRADPDIALALLPVLGARIRELDDQLVRLHHS